MSMRFGDRRDELRRDRGGASRPGRLHVVRAARLRRARLVPLDVEVGLTQQRRREPPGAGFRVTSANMATKHRGGARVISIWMAALSAATIGCGPSVVDEGSDEMTSGPGTTTNPSSPGDASSTMTGPVSETAPEPSGSTSPDPMTMGPLTTAGSTGPGPMVCERGTWSGALRSYTGFNGFTVELSACDPELSLVVEGLDTVPSDDCGDAGFVEISGRLCSSDSGEPVLIADSIVGPCDGTCGSPGRCAEFQGECFDDYLDCDLVAQDCPPGTKCAPWRTDGGPTLVGATCREIDPDPDGVGDPCVSEDEGLLGLDSCDIGLLCWGPELKDLPWQCIEQCDPDGATPCQNGEPCSACPTLPQLGLCLPADTPTPIAICDDA